MKFYFSLFYMFSSFSLLGISLSCLFLELVIVRTSRVGYDIALSRYYYDIITILLRYCVLTIIRPLVCDVMFSFLLVFFPCTPLAAHRVNFAIRFAFSFCICLVAKTRSPLSPNRGSVGGRDARTNNLI